MAPKSPLREQPHVVKSLSSQRKVELKNFPMFRPILLRAYTLEIILRFLITAMTDDLSYVYGPVSSWRYGRSLGIDPIGAVSTCSFNCVYCQLGEIERKTSARHVYVPTEAILRDLEKFAPWEVDTLTCSGSGEPTLAANLEELIAAAKAMTHRPLGVLTNGTLLGDAAVVASLAIADWVSIKVDAVTRDRLQRVDRPVFEYDLEEFWRNLQAFRAVYRGQLGIQTMVLSPWSAAEESEYMTRLAAIAPDEIQLNAPSRPKPLTHQIEARGNHLPEDRDYPTLTLKPISREALAGFGDRVRAATGIAVRYPPTALFAGNVG